MTETRKENRLQVALVVRYREPSMTESREAAAQDLALGGMFVLTPRPSPRGALLNFECIASGPADKFTGTARVIWQRNKADPRGPAGMGVRFIRLEPGSREAVMRLIEQSGAENGAKGPSSRPPPRKSIPPVEVARPLSISGAPISLETARPDGGTDSISRGLRVPTLRNVTMESAGKPSSALPPSSAAARAESSVLRERLDRTRRGMPPTAESGDANRPAATPQPIRHLSGTLLGVGDRKSERPPVPGGVDDLRPLIPIPVRKLSDPPDSQTRSSKPPGHTRRSSQTMLEISSSRPPPKSGTPPPSTGPAVHAVHNEPSAADPRPGKPPSTPPPHAPPADFEAEPVADFGKARKQPFRAPLDAAIELPNPDRGRKGSRWLAWTVIGGGVAFSLLLGVMFGGGAVRLPEQVGETESNTPSALDPSAPTPSNADLQPTKPMAAAIPYALDVETQPSGARVSAAGRFIMAPGRLELGALGGTTTVTAELAGYRATSLDVVPREFALHDGVYVRRLLIALPQEIAKEGARAPAPAAQATPRKPKAAQGSTPSAQTAAAPILVSPPPGTASPAPTGESPRGESPLDRARACLSQGDNACVVRELEDKASTAAELEMLIETYRAIGSSARAEQRMQQYLERFPNGKRAEEYKRRLTP